MGQSLEIVISQWQNHHVFCYLTYLQRDSVLAGRVLKTHRQILQRTKIQIHIWIYPRIWVWETGSYLVPLLVHQRARLENDGGFIVPASGDK